MGTVIVQLEYRAGWAPRTVHSASYTWRRIIWTVFYGIAAASSLHVLVKIAHVSCATSLPQLLGTYLGGNFQFIFEICLTFYW